jgi:signal transduction histidine kinase
VSALLQEWAEIAGFSVEFRCNRPSTRLDAEIELALFRIVQEALNNIVKHAASSLKVTVTLKFGVRTWDFLAIEDDGPGLKVESRASRCLGNKWGLNGMRERLQSIGGSLDVISFPGFGTTILARRDPLTQIVEIKPLRKGMLRLI